MCDLAFWLVLHSCLGNNHFKHNCSDKLYERTIKPAILLQVAHDFFKNCLFFTTFITFLFHLAKMFFGVRDAYLFSIAIFGRHRFICTNKICIRIVRMECYTFIVTTTCEQKTLIPIQSKTFACTRSTKQNPVARIAALVTSVVNCTIMVCSVRNHWN